MIIDAAEQLLLTVTARELSVAQILKAAGVSRGTFYHYFTSKWELIMLLAMDAIDEFQVHAEEFTSADSELPRDEALWRSVEVGAELFAVHRGVFRAIIEHWREVPELRVRWLQIMEQVSQKMAAGIDLDRANGSAPPGPPSRELAATLMWSSVTTLYIAGLGQSADLRTERDTVPSLFRLWYGSIFGPEAPVATFAARRPDASEAG